jgi:hypothetical protein
MHRPDDGGPVYPFSYVDCGEEMVHPGISRRDWFAGQALVGLMSDPTLRPCTVQEFEHMAKRLFQVADAMIAEGKKEAPDNGEGAVVVKDGTVIKTPYLGTNAGAEAAS